MRTIATIATIVLALATLRTSPALADDASDLLWTTRAAIGELGFRAPDDAYAAIAEVHVRRAAAQGVTLGNLARRYSAALRTARRPWVASLTADPTSRPFGWPENLLWPPRAARFAEVLEVIRATLAGRRPQACPGAVHYGSTDDGPPSGGLALWEPACRFEGTTQLWWRRR